MKKLLLIASLFCATALVVQAEDAVAPKKAKKDAAEQKQVIADMVAKYDTNKDGKLDKSEKAAMTPEDKAAYTKAVAAHAKKKAADKAPDAAAPKADAGK